jgi:hypothetical protein
MIANTVDRIIITKIIMAVSLISKSTCTESYSKQKIKGKACNFLIEFKHFKVYVHMKYI